MDEEFVNDIVSGKAVRFVQLNAQKSQFATIELQKQVETLQTHFYYYKNQK